MKSFDQVIGRMEIFFLVVICRGIWPSDATAQLAARESVTAGFTNGRFWLDMPNSSTKTTFLLGCGDGLLMGARLIAAEKPKIADDLKLPKLTFPEIIKELDLFYLEGANGPIPIVQALEYVRHKAEGDSPENLQFLLMSYRKLAVFLQ